MTREHKLALVVGFGLVLFVGILIADHMAAEGRSRTFQQGPAAMTEPMPDDLFQFRSAQLPPARSAQPTQAPAHSFEDAPSIGDDPAPAVVFADPEPRRHLARPATRDITYTVRRGDSLTSIAQRHLGNQNRWREIQKFNGLKGSGIKEGQTLRIPLQTAAEGSSSSRPSTRLREVDLKPQKYKVRPGDSLGRIARRELGDESRWDEIQDLNNIGGTTIHTGQVLLLPTR